MLIFAMHSNSLFLLISFADLCVSELSGILCSAYFFCDFCVRFLESYFMFYFVPLGIKTFDMAFVTDVLLWFNLLSGNFY